MHHGGFVIHRNKQEIQRVVVMMDKGGVNSLHYELAMVGLVVRSQILFTSEPVISISPAYQNFDKSFRFGCNLPDLRLSTITELTFSGGRSTKQSLY